jgi:glutamate synthase domain-containing protein 2
MSRFAVFGAILALTVVVLAFGLVINLHLLWVLLALVPLAGLGCWDVLQTRHSILRNYPVIGHLRWLFEGIRPEIRQYLVESDDDAVPFSREQRALVYQRAKGEPDKLAFGTQLNVYADGFAWLNHSLAPVAVPDADFRVTVGGPQCRRPYDASLLNISAMSFGALSGNAIQALNKGARMGGFAHDTGEGAISRHHRLHGGDLIWEIGSGYFGCRRDDGGFDPDRFAERAAEEQVRMIEIKLSQGAKPGHGGVLPAAKISPEIAEARGIDMGRDCVSPAAHSAFSTPVELIGFIDRLRDLSGGKPVGFKLCIGHPSEFLGIVKAMLETGSAPDFIVIDGKEGGTGAAPLEFSNRLGTPLVEGLTFAQAALVGAGLRGQVRLAASGKLISAFDMASVMALGADWCNAARAFMFAVGCIQARQCHTNCCPVGVATQDPIRQRALAVDDKAMRVARFHAGTMKALAELTAATGLSHPEQLNSGHLMIRRNGAPPQPASLLFPQLAPGELIHGTDHPYFAEAWQRADPRRFGPA